MLDLARLVQIVRSSDSPRSHVFEAIRQIMERFPSVAHDEFEWILKDADVSPRPRVFVLYWLREFDHCEDLVNAYITPLREWVDKVVVGIENDEEAGVDPFPLKDFPDA